MPPGFIRKSEFSLLEFVYAVCGFTLAYAWHGYSYFLRPGFSDTSWQRWGSKLKDAWPGQPPTEISLMATIANPDIKDLEETTLLNVMFTLTWMLVLNWLLVYLIEMWGAAPDQVKNQKLMSWAWRILEPIWSKFSWVVFCVCKPKDEEFTFVMSFVLAFILLWIVFRNPEQVLEGTLMLTVFQFLTTLLYGMVRDRAHVNMITEQEMPGKYALWLFFVPYVPWIWWRLSEQRSAVYKTMSHPICVTVVLAVVFGLNSSSLPIVTVQMQPHLVFKHDVYCGLYEQEIKLRFKSPDLKSKIIVMSEGEWNTLKIPNDKNQLCGVTTQCGKQETEWTLAGNAGLFLTRHFRVTFDPFQHSPKCKKNTFVYFTWQTIDADYFMWLYDTKADHDGYMARWGIICALVCFIWTKERSDFEASDLTQMSQLFAEPGWKMFWHWVSPTSGVADLGTSNWTSSGDHSSNTPDASHDNHVVKRCEGRGQKHNKGKQCIRNAQPGSKYCGYRSHDYGP